ncbi:PPOX class F420-dependent oxidoreductase [Saccharopolyspora subtropica]|uniref:PPOX class F420-dependent oxidoreductase n=1 Tax=Saccharopolyspora thermophila TaxID=89367 RepID=A0A917NE01_9PSEU|nr:PPOX class F420-dependent oxidoreductase [Saccharopolyspora subtropica]
MPVVFAVRGEVIVTAVDRKPKRSRQLRRLRNIAENPRVAVLVDHYEDDWSRLWWVRADGEAELAEAETHPELLAALVAKYPQYHEEPPTGPLVVIRVSRWSGWSGAG